MKKELNHLLVWVTVFAIAMGFLESSVVVYLREIYYPKGFNFPLAPIDAHIAFTEIIREAATLIMLLGIGVLAGKNLIERFAWFIYTFAIWDIFYYVFLKLLISWPESFFTWDILFLIPVTWVGPVLSPILVSGSMIILALLILWLSSIGAKIKLGSFIWSLLIIGSLILIVSFTWDYSTFILEHFSISELWSLPDKNPLYDLSVNYIPRSFPWLLFWVGETVIGLSIVLIYRKNKLKLPINKTKR